MNNNNPDSMRELRRHGDALLPIKQYCNEQVDGLLALDCHWHGEMELFCVTQGAVTMQCGTRIFEARTGDIAFFNSGELHAAVPTEGTNALSFRALVFSPELFCAAANDILRVKYINPVINGELLLPTLIENGTSLHSLIFGLFNEIYDLLESHPELFEFSVKADMLKLFSVLVSHGRDVESTSRRSSAAANIKSSIQYILDNYKTPITVEKLSEVAGMSEGHFCRTFKQYTLKTPIQFINSIRLAHAAEQLSGTDKRVLDIALDCGFNSVSYFIEVFRDNFNITPSRYRKNNGDS